MQYIRIDGTHIFKVNSSTGNICTHKYNRRWLSESIHDKSLLGTSKTGVQNQSRLQGNRRNQSKNMQQIVVRWRFDQHILCIHQFHTIHMALYILESSLSTWLCICKNQNLGFVIFGGEHFLEYMGYNCFLSSNQFICRNGVDGLCGFEGNFNKVLGEGGNRWVQKIRFYGLKVREFLCDKLMSWLWTRLWNGCLFWRTYE